MKLKLYEQEEEIKIDEPDASTIDKNLSSLENLPQQAEEPQKPTFHYDYIGYLKIPKIGLRRGFVAKGSKYNDIEHNVTIAESADYPDKEKGNFILMAHSGYGYLAFFQNLYRLEIGDIATVTYKNKTYTYKLVNAYLQDKTGKVAIFRNFDIKALTLITCTYQDDLHQSIYVFEPAS